MAFFDPQVRRDLYRDAGEGTVMLAQFLAAPLTWGAIGWAIDTYVTHTYPWVLVGGLVLGFTLGMYLMYLRMMQVGRAEDERRRNV